MQVSAREAQDVVMLCCGIKPACGWNCERAGSVCRERCGGQGYLSCNRFGDIIGFAHAAVTAEGDNRVLMQKTAKELLSMAEGDPATRARLAAASSSSRQVRTRHHPGCAALVLRQRWPESTCKPFAFARGVWG